MYFSLSNLGDGPRLLVQDSRITQRSGRERKVDQVGDNKFEFYHLINNKYK